MLKKVFYRAIFWFTSLLGLKGKLLERLSRKISYLALYHHHFHYYCSAIFTYIGHIYLIEKKNEAALGNYNSAIFQDHDNKFALLGKSIIEQSKVINSKLFDNTLSYLDKLVSQLDYSSNHVSQNAILDLGFSHIKAKEFKMAMECFDKCHHKSGRLLLGVGLAYFYQKKYHESLEAFEKAGDLALNEHDTYHKEFSQKHYQRAIFYFLNQDYDLSVMDLTKSLDLAASNIEALLLRAQIYLAKENYPSAISDYNKILELVPNNRTAKNNLKQIYKVIA